MPFNVVDKLLNDTEEDGNYIKKKTILSWGKTEYHITKQLISEAGEELKETAEKIFNASVQITQEELEKKIYNEDFIIDKMRSVISNYESME